MAVSVSNHHKGSEVKRKLQSKHQRVAKNKLVQQPNPGDLLASLKQAEAEIRRQHELLLNTFDSMMDAVFILEAKHPPTPAVIVNCNKAAVNIFGYSKDEMIGKPTEFLHVNKDSLLRFQSLLFSAVKREQLPFHLANFQMKRKDGTIFDSEHTVSQLVNEKGERTGWVSVIRDIAERKQLSEEVNSLARFPSENPNPVFRIRREGMISESNNATESLFKLWGCERRGKAPKFLRDIVNELLSSDASKNFEVELGDKTYGFFAKPNLVSHDVNFYGRDISARKRMEKELQEYATHLEDLVKDRTTKLAESEERYRLAKEQLEYAVFSNPAAIHISKPLPDLSDFLGKFMSKSINSLLGFEAEQLLGESGGRFWESRIPPEDLQKYRSEIPMLWKDGEHSFEYRFRHKDGSYRWIHEKQRVVRDPEGNPRDVIGYLSDITERKRLEEELHSAKEQLEYAVFSNPAVICTSKPLPDLSDFTQTFISKSVRSVLGIEAEQLLGESGARFWESRLPVEDLQKFRAETPMLWRDGHHVFEYRFLHKDGKYRWIREEQRVIRDAEGKVRDVVGYWIDISREKKLEEALRTSEDNLRKANEGLELAIVETTEQIESIANLREKLRQTPDLSTGLEMVLEKILWEFGMEIGAIFAFDREKGIASLQALKTQSGDMSLEKTYSLNNGFIEFEATPTKSITTLVAEGDNSILKTRNVNSTAIMVAGKEVYGVLTFGGSKTEKLTDIDQIILEFYTELISQTITERRLTVEPVRETPLLKGTSPTRWAASLEKLELEVGIIYITKNDVSFAYEVFSKFVSAGFQGLCVTREQPSKLRKRLGLEKTPIIWLAGESSPNEQTIGSMQDLSITLGDFLQKAKQPILLLDGFEYLIANNTFESFLKFLQIIRGRVQNHNAIVIAPVLEKAFEPRTLALIERETTTLEPKS
jgi:PAS domain S-box-containing protein